MQRHLTNFASAAGALLMVDDLQWAGPDALDLPATLLRGVALAIAAGVAWLLVVEEGLQLSGFSSPLLIAVLEWLPRWNADALAHGLGPWAAELQAEPLPGHDTVPHSLAVLILYILAFIAVGTVAFCRRDVKRWLVCRISCPALSLIPTLASTPAS